MKHNAKRASNRHLAEPTASDPRRFYELIGLALILLATFIVYQPALRGGMLVDDDGNITPPNLRPISGLYHIWFDPTVTAQYYPIVHTAFWIEHRLWGDSFLGYHLVTLLWHAVSVTLLYFIIHRLEVPGALLAAAIFALHPVMVESVAWMCEQKNTLSTMLYLSAMLLYLKFDASRLRSHYFVALGLFLLALLAKTVTVTFPAALLVIFWWKRGRVELRRDVTPLLPFFALSAAIGLVTVWVEQNYFHGQESGFSLTFAQRFLLAGRAIWFYLGKLAWPASLMFTYPRWTIDPTQWWQWIYPVAALGTTLALWTVRKRWRAAGWLARFLRYALAGDWFCKCLHVRDYIRRRSHAVSGKPGDHRALCSRCCTRCRPSRKLHTVGGSGICVFSCGSLAAFSWQQSRLYGDVVTYYETLLAGNPESWLAHNNLGLALSRQGKTQEAFEHYQAAVRIKPNFALAHRNLGAIHADAGRHSDAIAEFRAGLAFEPKDPQSLNGLGLSLINTGRPDEAIDQLRRAIELYPDYAEAHNNLGIALGIKGDVANAVKEFQRTLQINHNFANAHSNWGKLLADIGQKPPAIDHFRQAVQLDSNNPNGHYNLAALLAESGQTLEAISHFEQAIRLRADFVEAYSSLAQSLASANRAKEAIAVARRGIEVGRSRNHSAATDELGEWLKHYQTELQRAAEPPSAERPK